MYGVMLYTCMRYTGFVRRSSVCYSEIRCNNDNVSTTRNSRLMPASLDAQTLQRKRTTAIRPASRIAGVSSTPFCLAYGATKVARSPTTRLNNLHNKINNPYSTRRRFQAFCSPCRQAPSTRRPAYCAAQLRTWECRAGLCHPRHSAPACCGLYAPSPFGCSPFRGGSAVKMAVGRLLVARGLSVEGSAAETFCNLAPDRVATTRAERKQNKSAGAL